MASVVTSLVSTYLKVFLKDYNKQQLNFHLRSGECCLTNIKLDEQILHHLMGLPATIAIESISCANLKIKVPWRHFKSEPMSVTLEQVVVQMTELPTAGPPDKAIPKLDKIIQMLNAGGGTKSLVEPEKIVQRILEDISVQITDLRMSMRLLNQERNARGPSAMLSVAMFMLRTTDSKGNVVKLSQARDEGKRGSTITVHKELVLGSSQFSVGTTLPDGTMAKSDVLKIQPSSLHITMTRSQRDKSPRSVTVNGTVPLVLVQFDKSNYNTLMEAITSFLWCVQDQKINKDARKGDGSLSLTDADDLAIVQGDEAEDFGDDLLDDDMAEGPGEETDSSALVRQEESTIPTIRADIMVCRMEVRCQNVAKVSANGCRLALLVERPPSGSGIRAYDLAKHRQITACCVLDQLLCTDIRNPEFERPVFVRPSSSTSQPVLRVQASYRPTLRGIRPSTKSLPYVELYADVAPIDVVVMDAFVKQCIESFFFKPKRPWPKRPKHALSDTFWFLEDIRVHASVPHVSAQMISEEPKCTLRADIHSFEVNCMRSIEMLSSYYSAAFSNVVTPEKKEHKGDYLFEPEDHEVCLSSTQNMSTSNGPFSLIRGSVSVENITLSVEGPAIPGETHKVNIVEILKPKVRAELFRPLEYLDGSEVQQALTPRGRSDMTVMPAFVVKGDVGVRVSVDHAALWHCTKLLLHGREWTKGLVAEKTSEKQLRSLVKKSGRRAKRKVSEVSSRFAAALHVRDLDVSVKLDKKAVPTLFAELDSMCKKEGIEKKDVLVSSAKNLVWQLLLNDICPSEELEIAHAHCSSGNLFAKSVYTLSGSGTGKNHTLVADGLLEGVSVTVDTGSDLNVYAVLKTKESDSWVECGKVAGHVFFAEKNEKEGKKVSPSCNGTVQGVSLELGGSLSRCIELAHRIESVMKPFIRNKVKTTVSSVLNASEATEDVDDEKDDEHHKRQRVKEVLKENKAKLFGVDVTADVEDISVSYTTANRDEPRRTPTIKICVAPAVPKDEIECLKAMVEEDQRLKREQQQKELAEITAKIEQQVKERDEMQTLLVESKLRADDVKQQSSELDRTIADLTRQYNRETKLMLLMEQENMRIQDLLGQKTLPKNISSESISALSEEIVELHSTLEKVNAERTQLEKQIEEKSEKFQQELEQFQREKETEEQELEKRIQELEKRVQDSDASTSEQSKKECAVDEVLYSTRMAERENKELSMFIVMPSVVQVWDGVEEPEPPPPSVSALHHRAPPTHTAPKAAPVSSQPPPRPPKPASLMPVRDPNVPPPRPPKPASVTSSVSTSPSSSNTNGFVDPFADLLGGPTVPMQPQQQPVQSDPFADLLGDTTVPIQPQQPALQPTSSSTALLLDLDNLTTSPASSSSSASSNAPAAAEVAPNDPYASLFF